jgi:hypothetical protein
MYVPVLKGYVGVSLNKANGQRHCACNMCHPWTLRAALPCPALPCLLVQRRLTVRETDCRLIK